MDFAIAAIQLDEGIVRWLALGTVAVVAILAHMVVRSISTSQRERSRREIAAYIAEGSISPEQGEKLMDAGKPAWEKDEWFKG